MWHFCGVIEGEENEHVDPPEHAVTVKLTLTASVATGFGPFTAELISQHDVEVGWVEELSELPELLRTAAGFLSKRVDEQREAVAGVEADEMTAIIEDEAGFIADAAVKGWEEYETERLTQDLSTPPADLCLHGIKRRIVPGTPGVWVCDVCDTEVKAPEWGGSEVGSVTINGEPR